MAVYKSAAALRLAQQKRFATMKGTFVELIRERAYAGLEDFQELTSGALTPGQTHGAFARGQSPAQSTPMGARRRLSQLQRKRRGLKGVVPLLPINKVTGRLHRSGMILRHGDKFLLVSRGVPYAEFVVSNEGTRKMVGRRLRNEIKMRAAARLHGILANMKARSI